jgi:ribA/ribD-fused uncharacterized protein
MRCLLRNTTQTNVEENHMADTIRFYSRKPEYFELSNFAPFGFEDEGLYWPTVEHYFQAQKFPTNENADYREFIRQAQTPNIAKSLGRTRKIAIRPAWDEVKDDIMLYALRKKFENNDLRELLLNTGDRTLIEASPFDTYWGCGRSGKGRNRLGELLMQVRAEIKAFV